VSEFGFAVGIDLGTTNCALSFVPLDKNNVEEIETDSMPIPQLTAPGTVEARCLLPSFIYIPHPDEFHSLLPTAFMRYIVGIDLGTTDTVVAYADVAEAKPRLFEIEQLVVPGEVGRRPMLPSVRYHPARGELAEQDTVLPWPPTDVAIGIAGGIIGELAQELGSRVPCRLVTSAKSWLSHRSVDRTEPVLPWGAHDEVAKVSPVAASASYLAHVRAAWNQRFPGYPLQKQEIVLTVPASFDEAARALTLEAARIAGLSGIRLIEEPQAACYDWLSKNQGELSRLLHDIRLLFVCDIAAGTTDFTPIKVEPQNERPQLTRIAVGDHLMLGGDNMDLALAHVAEGRIMASGVRLGAAGLSQLVQQCRLAKESLLAPGAPEKVTVTVVGAGSRITAGAKSTELSREKVQQILVEGFYPRTAPDERPRRIRGGIVEFGLRRELEALLGERYSWDTTLLRELFSAFWDGTRHRRRSTDHERVWFNLAGFCLRPGFGFPLDDWHVQQLWSVHEQGVQYAKEAQVWAEWWILWRRVAGGLDRYAQEELLSGAGRIRGHAAGASERGS
jgi:molecular chaperone DnaK (HSP70)